MRLCRARSIFFQLSLCLLAVYLPAAQGQEIDIGPAAVPVASAEAEEGRPDALQTFSNLLETRRGKEEEVDNLIAQLRASTDDIEREMLRDEATALNAELGKIEDQIGILATGVSAGDFDLVNKQRIDLRAEAEELVQPFVIMLKSATAGARKIEQLKHQELTAEQHEEIANKAIAGIEPLLATNLDSARAAELQSILANWQRKLGEATDLKTTVQHQRQALEAAQVQARESSSVFGSFFKERGLSFLLGVGAFLLVLTGMKLLGRLAGYAGHRSGVPRSYQVRLTALIFNIVSFLAALGSMMYIFNMRNDWLLLGVVVLIVVGLLWMGIKMLPEMMERITLLLDLGAVQEGERLIFQGVPWRVERLDVYTDLVNPALDGGTYTLPVRELLGLHSRPAAKDEVWFPTRLGDWVKMEDGTVAKVVFQSPELVQVVALGGARQTIPAATFFSEAPTNLSSNARVEVVFGISYKHQAIATKEVPEQLIKNIQRGLLELLSPEELLDVHVELLATSSSSLDYEVEADLHGSAAAKYEDVERALTRLCVETCNEQGWEIPFPQLVVHQA